MFEEILQNNQQTQLKEICELLSQSQILDRQNCYHINEQYKQQKDNIMQNENSYITSQNLLLQLENKRKEKMIQEQQAKRITKHWTLDEDEELNMNYIKYNGNWNLISKAMKLRNKSQCGQRWRRLHPGSNRKSWSQQEDYLVLKLVEQYGKNWTILSDKVEGRSGKQIRERYVNKLDNTINREKWSEQEDQIIIQKYQQIGARWSEISTYLSGRPENWIKNRFYGNLQKQVYLFQDTYSNLDEKQEYLSQTNEEKKDYMEETIYYENTDKQIQKTEESKQQSLTYNIYSPQQNNTEEESWVFQIPNFIENQQNSQKINQYTMELSPKNIPQLQKIHTRQQSFMPENDQLFSGNENYQLSLAFQQKQNSEVQFDINGSQDYTKQYLICQC